MRRKTPHTTHSLFALCLAAGHSCWPPSRSRVLSAVPRRLSALPHTSVFGTRIYCFNLPFRTKRFSLTQERKSCSESWKIPSPFLTAHFRNVLSHVSLVVAQRDTNTEQLSGFPRLSLCPSASHRLLRLVLAYPFLARLLLSFFVLRPPSACCQQVHVNIAPEKGWMEKSRHWRGKPIMRLSLHLSFTTHHFYAATGLARIRERIFCFNVEKIPSPQPFFAFRFSTSVENCSFSSVWLFL